MRGQQIQQMKQLSHHEEDDRALNDQIQSFRKSINYGKLIVLFKGKLHVSIGPDYPFTLFGLFFILTFSYFVYKFQSLIDMHNIGKAINYFMALLPSLSYIWTSLSNPGIYNQYENNEPKTKYCQICKVFKPKNVFHCMRCDLCIEQYDHHCPWMSKCIGKGNIISFFFFLGSMSATFFYFFFMIFTLMSQPSK